MQQGVLPGRPWLQEQLGLNGEAGVVPDVEPGPVEEGSFVSARRGGVATGWSLIRPPGDAGRAAPRGRAARPGRRPHDAHRRAVRAGPVPGRRCGRRRTSVRDRGRRRRYDVLASPGRAARTRARWSPRSSCRCSPSTTSTPSRVGFIGWSMGGYGALRLAGLLGAERVAAVSAVSPAIWADADSASEDGFEDAAEYEEFTVFGHQTDLAGIPVRVDCGTGDPFYREVESYVAGFPPGADLTSSFEPGGHDGGVLAPDAARGARVPRPSPRRRARRRCVGWQGEHAGLRRRRHGCGCGRLPGGLGPPATRPC